ncbi:carboxypeptidase-like regulatory domain-containing protein [Aquisphaera insulae]|uniref:carboxypeptidase-like regulatory domain-containing protein n=1 Tax=Aquisphaera insulae TaxID=2712864 RepID=UPI0013EB4FD8|nr:carboxypeptidase-like regulatory domain-containing protein [Aquisphaera insulae]
MSWLPLVLSLLAQEPAPLSGTAVDREGRPVVGVEIVLSHGPADDGTVPVLSRATTDAQGRYEILPPAADRRPQRRQSWHLSAYRPGSGLVVSVTHLKAKDADGYRLALLPAGRRTFTVRGDDGRPIAGVRLTPLTVLPRQPNYFITTLPTEIIHRVSATTGADGRAELTCLEPTTELFAVLATIPGLGTHALSLTEDQRRSEAVTLDLRAGGQVAGRVLRPDGRPATGAEVVVWSRSPGRAVEIMSVHFEAGPIRTSDDGTFRTPPVLLANVKYRAIVHAEGFRPVLTEWVTAAGKRDGTASLADVVLMPPRSISGRVVDRQGKPVAEAAVIAGGGGVSAATDDRGTFRLDGLPAGPAPLVVRRDGYRIDGRIVEGPGGPIEVTLARFDEPATAAMTTLPGPIPLDDRRRLARRVLAPFLAKVLAKGKDSDKAWALRSLMTFDPAAALEAIEKTPFEKTAYYQSFLRYALSLSMARDDPDEAAAVAESIPEAYRRAQALTAIAVTLPKEPRDRKRAIVDRVLVAARAEPEPRLKVWQLGEAAELLLDLGETDQARAVFAEGRPIAERLGPDAEEFIGYFASRLGRVDLPAALALLGGPDKARDHCLAIGNLAARIAATDPAEAERLIDRVRDLPRSSDVVLRTCQNMARADLPRARKISVEHDKGWRRAEALLFTAYGLPPSRKESARDLVREALAEIDRHDVLAAWSNPAALMPLAESIDPTLVPEMFWRAVAGLADPDDPREDHGQNDVLGQAILLARYDRRVAAALYEPAARAGAARGPDSGRMTPSEITLLAEIDPLRAVAAVEAMPEPPNPDTNGANWSRIILSAQLGRTEAGSWSDIWSTFSGLVGILNRRDVL